MKKGLRVLMFCSAMVFAGFLINCGDEDIVGQCAGCDSDAPWSVFGSDDCYETRDDCEAVEREDCVVCT